MIENKDEVIDNIIQEIQERKAKLSRLSSVRVQELYFKCINTGCCRVK